MKIPHKYYAVLSFLIILLPSAAFALDNPLGTTDIRVFIGYVIRALLGLSGSLALLMFVIGGITWLISEG